LQHSLLFSATTAFEATWAFDNAFFGGHLFLLSLLLLLAAGRGEFDQQSSPNNTDR
jgi:hypothetical protein